MLPCALDGLPPLENLNWPLVVIFSCNDLIRAGELPSDNGDAAIKRYTDKLDGSPQPANDSTPCTSQRLSTLDFEIQLKLRLSGDEVP
jgi:hypothetical protein